MFSQNDTAQAFIRDEVDKYASEIFEQSLKSTVESLFRNMMKEHE